MTPEEKFDQAIWEVLQKIKEEFLFSGEERILLKERKDDLNHNHFDFNKGEKVIFKKLEDLEAIKMSEGVGVLSKLPELSISGDNHDDVMRLSKNGGVDRHYLYSNILQPKFNKVYEEYRNKFNTLTKGREKDVKNLQDDLGYVDATLKKDWEKRWDVLEAIWESYNSADKKNEVYVFVKYLKTNEKTFYQVNDIMEIFKNKGCFDRYGTPGTWFDDSYYVIHNINIEKLEEVYKETKSIYEKFTESYKERQENIKKSKEEKLYFITYKGRQIMLNDKYLIKKLQFCRKNELFFEYIFNNSKKKIQLDEIKKVTKAESKVDFNKFVNEIGFKGELRKCFFEVSKTIIKFTNSLTQKDLEERNVNITELDKQIEKLKTC